ncbi:MAG: aspartate aminotransferase family protein, partial [Desulfovibrionales bacterium]
MTTSQLQAIREREEHLLCRTYGRYPLAISSASGSTLYDTSGRAYTDLLAGIAVCNLGHCHPELTRVLAEQAEKLVHVSNLFYQQEQLDLAEKLLSTCAADKVFFCNSGAEANEAAIKLARRYMRTVLERDAYQILTLEGSFHGRTLATLTATGQDKIKEGFDPLPAGFDRVPFADFEALSASVTERTAAVLLEVVQGEGGVRLLPGEYLHRVQDLCRERGILFMIDEVQTGLARTGRMWAHQHFDLAPDVFTAAKALANGLPMGAMLATDQAARGFGPGSHATTFGGGPVLSVVASQVLTVIEREDLTGRAKRLGSSALERFTMLQRELPGHIVDVRGLGLMLGIELAYPGQDVWRRLL